jgi:hypothetical protein
MSKVRIFRQVCVTLMLAVAVVAALVTGSGTASASVATAQNSTQRTPIKAVHAKMSLDCTHMSVAAHKYATGHGYCAAATTKITPNGVAYGDCGDSWIYIFDVGGGDADIDYGFDSSWGAAVVRNLSIGYAGWESSGGWSDSGWMSSSSYSSSREYIPVGPGDAYASMGGSIGLWWGGSCTLNDPSDSTWIS